MADNGMDIPEVVFATARCLSICVKVGIRSLEDRGDSQADSLHDRLLPMMT